MEAGQESAHLSDDSQEFEYTADVRAWETFRNQLRSLGVTVREGNPVTFRFSRLLDMRAMKQKGLLRSYKISKIAVIRQVIETG